MFYHVKQTQFDVKPDKPDALFAKRLQELLGGKFGETTVMMSYLMQGFTSRGPQKYKDLVLDIATEEIGHIEMLSIMISRLLDHAPGETQDEAAKNPLVKAALGGEAPQDLIYNAMNPQHQIVTGQGAILADSVGVPWSGAYATASGNLLADFRWNLMAETQGNLQVSRIYEMTEDEGVRRMLGFNLARDIAHQNQWEAAIQELYEDGLHQFHVPSPFPMERVNQEQMHTLWNLSEGEESAEGRWATGPAPDGMGDLVYLQDPKPLSRDDGTLEQTDPRYHGTPKKPLPAMSTGPNPYEGQKTPEELDAKALTKEGKKK